MYFRVLDSPVLSLFRISNMRVAECAPIDLRVSKPSEFCHRTPYESQTPWSSKLAESLPFFRQHQSPAFHQFKPMLYGCTPGLPPTNFQEIAIARPLVTNLVPTSPKPDQNTPSASPDSSFRGCDGCKSGNDKTEDFNRAGVKRRLSEGSTQSSSSNFSDDSNNNNERTKVESSETAAEADSVPEKKKKQPDVSRSISMDAGSHCKDIEDENTMKKGAASPKPSRMSISPASFSSVETENCDSSTRARTTRPFKAITSSMIMDPIPLSGPLGDFEAFRQTILSRVNSTNKSTNQNMRRTGNTANTHITDPAYWEKRKRNNEAAKRSRDARRRKEDEVAIRCAYLEQERILMLQENKMLKEALKKYQEYYMH